MVCRNRKFLLQDGWFAIQLSGTDPKVKLYFGVNVVTEADASERLSSVQKMVMNDIYSLFLIEIAHDSVYKVSGNKYNVDDTL